MLLVCCRKHFGDYTTPSLRDFFRVDLESIFGITVLRSHFGSRRAADIWIEIGVVSRRTVQFETSEMLQVIDEQLWMVRQTYLLGRVGLGAGVSLKDKLTKINEEILDHKRAAQWVMTRQEEIADILAPQNQINDALVPVKEETLGKMVGMPVACIMKDTREIVVDTRQERTCEGTGGKVVDVSVLCIMKDIHEVVMDIPSAFPSAQGEQIDHSLVPRTKEYHWGEKIAKLNLIQNELIFAN